MISKGGCDVWPYPVPYATAEFVPPDENRSYSMLDDIRDTIHQDARNLYENKLAQETCLLKLSISNLTLWWNPSFYTPPQICPGISENELQCEDLDHRN